MPLRLSVGTIVFGAEFFGSPSVKAALENALPFTTSLVLGTWLGEAAVAEVPELEDVRPENQTSYPSRGDILFDLKNHRLILAYGTSFLNSPTGQFAANAVANITQGRDFLPELGQLLLESGRQSFTLSLVQEGERIITGLQQPFTERSDKHFVGTWRYIDPETRALTILTLHPDYGCVVQDRIPSKKKNRSPAMAEARGEWVKVTNGLELRLSKMWLTKGLTFQEEFEGKRPVKEKREPATLLLDRQKWQKFRRSPDQ